MTVLEFETPPYSKTCGGDWHWAYSQRYRKFSSWVADGPFGMENRFQLLNNTSWDHLMYMVLIGGFTVWALTHSQVVFCTSPDASRNGSCITPKEEEFNVCKPNVSSTLPLVAVLTNATARNVTNSSLSQILSSNSTADLVNCTFTNVLNLTNKTA